METETRSVVNMTTKDKMAAFEEAALPYMDSLYRTALRLTRKDKDAEDLVQEAYLRAYKSFHQFQLGTNCKAWLFKIMANLHINNYQKQSRRPSSMSFDDVEDFYLYNKLSEKNEATKSGNVEEEVLSGFLDSEVKDAIEKLPYEFRITVILADIEGFRYQEIADILGCPIGTVRSRLSRGRKLLEKYLWDYVRGRNFFREKCKMTCGEAVENLVDFIHDEMDEDGGGEMKTHLEQCHLCCSRFEFEEKLSDVIKQKACKESCPADLRSKIKEVLKNLM